MNEENNYQNTSNQQDYYNNQQNNYNNQQNFNSQPNNYYQEPNQKPSNTLAIISLVTGILSAILMCCCTYAGIGLGIAAVITAIVHKSKTGSFNGMCIAGMICGILGAVLSIASIVLMFVGGEDSMYNQMMNMYEEILNGSIY